MLAPDAVDASLVDLGGLPRPEQDPAVLRVVEAIAALEGEVVALMAEVKTAASARNSAEQQAAESLAVGDEAAGREAQRLAAQLGTELVQAKGRLLAIGARLGGLAAERHAALAAACRDCTATWEHAEQVLGAALSGVEGRAANIRDSLFEVARVRRQLDQTTGPGEPVAVKFVRPPRPYGAGEIASFPAGEAARLVSRGEASYVDAWRRLAAGGVE